VTFVFSENPVTLEYPGNPVVMPLSVLTQVNIRGYTYASESNYLKLKIESGAASNHLLIVNGEPSFSYESTSTIIGQPYFKYSPYAFYNGNVTTKFIVNGTVNFTTSLIESVYSQNYLNLIEVIQPGTPLQYSTEFITFAPNSVSIDYVSTSSINERPSCTNSDPSTLFSLFDIQKCPIIPPTTSTTYPTTSTTYPTNSTTYPTTNTTSTTNPTTNSTNSTTNSINSTNQPPDNVVKIAIIVISSIVVIIIVVLVLFLTIPAFKNLILPRRKIRDDIKKKARANYK